MTISFQPSNVIRTSKASLSKYAKCLDDENVESTALDQHYWGYRFGLDSKKKSASAIKVQFAAPSAGSAMISDITFAPSKQTPYPMAIVNGPRVCVYGSSIQSDLHRLLSRTKTATNTTATAATTTRGTVVIKAEKSVSTGGSPAICASYRPSDGLLIAIGCMDGTTRVCHAKQRQTLKTFSPSNKLPVQSVGWLSSGQRLYSAGDDGQIHLYDLNSNSTQPITSFRGHGDSIRQVAMINKNIAVSASYDHTLRVWDFSPYTTNSNATNNTSGDENNMELSIMNHGAPVECLLVLPQQQKSYVLSGGGTMVKLWNPLTGALLYNIPTQHNKTITSLCYSTAITNFPTKNIHHRLLTSSLDGLIRIHALDSLYASNEDEIDIPFVFGMKVPNQTNITAMAMSPCQTRLVIGTSTGHLIIHQRAKYVMPTPKKRPLTQPKSGTYAYFMRGVNTPTNENNSATDDHIVIKDKKRRLTKFDKLLKTFSYADALDEALNTRDPQSVSKNKTNLFQENQILSFSFINKLLFNYIFII